MRRAMHRCRAGAVVAAAGLLVIGCSSETPRPVAAPPTQSPSPASAPTTSAASHGPDTPAEKRAIQATVETLRDFLDVWASQGPARAARYGYPRLRLTSDEGMPKLVSGSVESYSVRDWHGPTSFTLMVDLFLTFDGSPYAWNPGQNTRFVTPHRVGRHGRYLLEFNTSP